MPTEWLAFGPRLPCAFCGTHFACSAVRPATAVFIGVNHSALSCVLRSCDNNTERSVAGGGDGLVGVCARRLVMLAATNKRMLRIMDRPMWRILAIKGFGRHAKCVAVGSRSLNRDRLIERLAVVFAQTERMRVTG